MTRALAGPPKFFGLAVLPSGEILAATFAAGVVRAAGGAWEVVPELSGLSTNAVLPTSSGAVLVGTNGRGLFRSGDAGGSWKPVDAGPDTVYTLAEGDALYAGTAGEGVWQSADDGTTWTPVAGGPSPRSPVYSLAARPDGTVVAGTDGAGLWRSGGGTDPWRQVGPPGVTVHALVDDETAMFAGCSGQGVLRSSDGDTWTAASTGLDDLHVHCLTVDGGDTLLAGTGAGVFISRDGGATWSAANVGMGHSRIFSLASRGDGSFLAGGYDGVWRSTDRAASWRPEPTGLTASHVFAVAVGRTGVYAGTGNGLVHLAGEGRSWTPIDVGLDEDTTVYCVTVTDDGWVLCGTAAGCVISPDGGRTWRSENEGLTHIDIYALATLPSGEIVAGTNGGGVFRSDRHHPRWTASNDGLGDRVVHDLRVDRRRPAVRGHEQPRRRAQGRWGLSTTARGVDPGGPRFPRRRGLRPCRRPGRRPLRRRPRGAGVPGGR